MRILIRAIALLGLCWSRRVLQRRWIHEDFFHSGSIRVGIFCRAVFEEWIFTSSMWLGVLTTDFWWRL